MLRAVNNLLNHAELVLQLAAPSLLMKKTKGTAVDLWLAVGSGRLTWDGTRPVGSVLGRDTYGTS
ncbi:hypothetical protein E2C01_056489 [Portunus trituberculatus]|uniref:Uncharacterized protein n=1 Tax=Portunus trituberculatus TaxID=210409 RepID=A0A5B7H0N7_PORTR|nr:hypothetical protein [Portunus trituberculatus]